MPILAYDRAMDFNAFRDSLAAAQPPATLVPLLLALWWEANGDWSRAHEIAQEIHTREGAWVHAYLHRKEGDDGNAAYWYRQAGKPPFRGGSEVEWVEIVETLLAAL